jgi:acetyl-CoA acetyltransferase
MTQAWIVSTARTPIGTAYKGALRDVRAEVLARTVVEAVIERAGLPRETVEDIVLAESLYGGGDLARHAAVAAGLTGVPGQAINRHCAGGLTAVSNAAALVGSGMVETVIAGGVQSTSTGPELTWSRPDGTQWRGMAPTFPHTDDADDDVTLTVGFNVAEHYGLTREQMDRWARRRPSTCHFPTAACSPSTSTRDGTPVWRSSPPWRRCIPRFPGSRSRPATPRVSTTALPL